MSITYHKGDMLTSKAKVLVNPVNCLGVMGAGLALKFKQRWPEMFERYRILCGSRDRIVPGKLWITGWISEPKQIMCFPTKYHWKDPARLEYIEWGLRAIVLRSNDGKRDSIAFPQLGCGKGGLDWKDVQPIMVKYLEPLPIEVEIWEYSDVDNYRRTT